MADICELEWANEAFGGRPEATNLWIGGNDSVTSFHKVRASRIPAISAEVSGNCHAYDIVCRVCLMSLLVRIRMIPCVLRSFNPT